MGRIMGNHLPANLPAKHLYWNLGEHLLCTWFRCRSLHPYNLFQTFLGHSEADSMCSVFNTGGKRSSEKRNIFSYVTELISSLQGRRFTITLWWLVNKEEFTLPQISKFLLHVIKYLLCNCFFICLFML